MDVPRWLGGKWPSHQLAVTHCARGVLSGLPWSLRDQAKIWSQFSGTQISSPASQIPLESGSSAHKRFRIDLKKELYYIMSCKPMYKVNEDGFCKVLQKAKFSHPLSSVQCKLIWPACTYLVNQYAYQRVAGRRPPKNAELHFPLYYVWVSVHERESRDGRWLLFYAGDSANAVPLTKKLRTRVTCIWGDRRGQPARSAMDRPRPGRTPLLIRVSPVPGKYAYIKKRKIDIKHQTSLLYGVLRYIVISYLEMKNQPI